MPKHNTAQCCVMNIGSSTGYFDVKRGTRQEHPLSACLFTLASEVLFVQVRNDKSIKGFSIQKVVNQPTQPHGLGSIFVTPPNILKQQLTGYCSSPASSPMGRDNKHGWYEEHEKFVAIATRSLSSVLLVGDSLVNGLARYHRVWSKYLESLRELNFGVGGDRTQQVKCHLKTLSIPMILS